MKIATAATHRKEVQAISKLYEELHGKLRAEPDLLFLFCSVEYNVKKMVAIIQERAPGMSVHGGTSCNGIMTDGGKYTEKGGGLGILGLSDPDGNYGVGAAEIGTEPRRAAREAVNEALKNADCTGEVPAMV